MKKTALKTFVCSFVFSLFMIFSINGVFFNEKTTQTSELRISTKNITLFLHADAVSSSAKPLPTKKIALSNLPDVIPDYVRTKSQTPDHALSIDNNSLNESEIIMADNTDIIPLEFGTQKNNPEEKTEQIILPKAVYIPENNAKSRQAIQAEIISMNDTSPPDVKAPKNILLQREEYIPETLDVVAVYGPENEQEEQTSNTSLTTQSNNTNLQETDTNPDLLIPLERSSGHVIAAGGKITIASKAQESQVALADGKIPTKHLASTESSTISEEDWMESENQESGWETMSEKDIKNNRGNDDPWLVAQGVKFPKNKFATPDNSAKEEKRIKKLLGTRKNGSHQNKTELASNMVDNILIPIPKDLLNKDELKPRLEFPESPETLAEKEAEEIKAVEELKNQDKKRIQSEELSTSRKDLLSSITSLFSSSADNKGQTDSENGNDENKGIIGKIKNRFSEMPASGSGRILPAEIRLSFQPNRAEISGNTLKWIYAFAQKTIDEGSVILEIRLDGTSDTVLQQRRLNLLSNILSNKGVKPEKVKVVFTEREPNSFIVRTIRTNDESYNMEKNTPSSATEQVTRW